MELADYLAIRNLIHRYCDHLDRGDFDAMAQLFAHADVYYQQAAEPSFRSDPEGLAAEYRRNTRIYPETGTPRTRHVTTNLIIEPDGENRARCQSYFIVFQSAPGFPLQAVIGGTYTDEFEKVDGAWRFRMRRVECDLFGDLSAHQYYEVGPDNIPVLRRSARGSALTAPGSEEETT